MTSTLKHRANSQPLQPIMGLAFALISALLAGCATPAQTAGLAVGATTLAGAQMRSDELEQIYYLGVFDPVEQIPPSIYRITVRGQSSFLNKSRFASGWVPAPLIDSLSARADDAGFGETRFTEPAGATDLPSPAFTGRKLMMFGPEGFREAPKNHRLVIVMGGDPSAYFDAVDGALADMGGVTVQRGNEVALKQLTDAFSAATQEDHVLEKLLADARKALTPVAQ